MSSIRTGRAAAALAESTWLAAMPPCTCSAAIATQRSKASLRREPPDIVLAVSPLYVEEIEPALEELGIAAPVMAV